MLSPTFFHDLVAQTPVRVIALAGSVTVIVQLAKVCWPNAISGKTAVALNILTSVGGVLIATNPANFWSETTLAQVLQVAAAAAGVHATAKTLMGQPIGVAGASSASAVTPTAPDPIQNSAMSGQ